MRVLYGTIQSFAEDGGILTCMPVATARLLTVSYISVRALMTRFPKATVVFTMRSLLPLNPSEWS